MTTKAIHTFQEGDLFDNRYRLVKRAGSGGFADVWKAEDTLRKNKVVALKIYTRLDDDGIQQMSEEYDATEYLRHPNLLTGNHFAAVDNLPYMEMQFCDGGSMASRVGKLTVDELHHVMHDILSGLAYLHSKGVVHQDIKPENILYDSQQDIYLLADFGISGKSRTRLSKSVQVTGQSMSMTLAYAPPEKYSGEPADREPSTKGDIFSLGVTLYELASGMLPFEPPMYVGQLMMSSGGKQAVCFDNIADPQLRQITRSCMNYCKENRPTAEELLATLNGIASPKIYRNPNQGKSGRLNPTVKVNNQSTIEAENRSSATKKRPKYLLYILVFAVAVALGAILIKQIHPHIVSNYNPADTVGEFVDIYKLRESVTKQYEGENLVITIGDVSFKMVYVQGGSFLMGAQGDDDRAANYDPDAGVYDLSESPVHLVHVNAFYMGQTEVTQALWETVMGTSIQQQVNKYEYGYGNIVANGENLPITYVNWYEAEEFANRLRELTGLNFQLPTEEEWEYAARGGNKSRKYRYSGSNDIGRVAWYGGNSGDNIHPVAQKMANELGLYDMNGNVTEWCSDCWREDYNSESDCSFRVQRGEDHIQNESFYRVSKRNQCMPDARHDNIGFRVVCYQDKRMKRNK